MVLRHVALIIGTLLVSFLTSSASPKVNNDTLVLNRVYNFETHFAGGVNGFTSNVYVKNLYAIDRRNLALQAIPSLYNIARGRRTFISEQYQHFSFRDVDDYDAERHVYATTIPSHRRAMDVLQVFITPNLYGETIYGDHILSPFNRGNRIYYHYNTALLPDSTLTLIFRPRFSTKSTLLVKGKAKVDVKTGRIIEVEMEGEFDMIRFSTKSVQGKEGAEALLPQQNHTDVTFKFLGNAITSHVDAYFGCPVYYPDTFNISGSHELFDTLRPVPLNPDELFIYAAYDSLHAKKTETAVAEAALQPTPHGNVHRIKWDAIGDNLLRSLRAGSEQGYVKLSPIINPQYLSYSNNKGFSYKLKLGAQYRFSERTTLNFSPTLGYTTKRHQLFFTTPLRLNFMPERNGHIDLKLGNGNRIGMTAIAEEIKTEQGTDGGQQIEDAELDKFNDLYTNLLGGLQLFPWLQVEAGAVYHRRTSVNKAAMKSNGKPSIYRSMAPMLSVKLRPWPSAPLFSIDYERGLSFGNSYLVYERWEADASLKHNMVRKRMLNLRIGAGFYTRKDKSYFMDFSNFRDENLPEGWADDWTGNFQLLSSSTYNSSDYYMRGNISYESPLLALSFVPMLGRLVERERIYWSALLIADRSPYSEIGYGFSCRFFSMGLFASLSQLRFREVGCKFTFELFRKW